MKKGTKYAVFGVVLLAGTALIMELAFALLVTAGARFRFDNHDILRGYYVNHEIGVIQFRPDCAQYDSILAYRLRPGECRVKQREFRFTSRVNSLGVRDDEQSLERPEVVVVGDSHAMAWGVEQQQGFADLLEKRSGLRVLNTGISSYGTPREMAILRLVDLGNTRYLIVQYCANDFRENREYQRSGHLDIMAESTYFRWVREQTRQRRYLPFEHTAYFLPVAWNMFTPDRDASAAEPPPPSEDVLARTPAHEYEEVDVFLHALANAPVDLSGIQIIVTELNDLREMDSDFASRLRERATSGEYPRHIREMTVVDLSPLLTAEDYFVFDGHMRPSGHEKVARALADVLVSSTPAR